MKSALRIPSFILASVAMLACDSGSEGLLSIDATGSLNGLAFIDINASGELEGTDAPAAGVSIALVMPGNTEQVIARATSSISGIYSFANVPVGRYGLVVESSALGDSLQVISNDSATVTVAANDTAITLIGLGYQQFTVAQIASLPVGRPIILRGVALNAWTSFGDSTLHVADSTGVLRVIRVRPVIIAAGDTVRLLGSVLDDGGTRTIGDATAFRVATAPLTRVPVLLSTAQAVTAAGGTLGNDLVRIDSATIVNTQVLPTGELAVNVDDGSGLLQVTFEPTGGFATVQNVVPGALLDATGLLVRLPGGSWQLKPRNAADVSANFQRVTVAQARSLIAGRLVQIEGLALNSYIAFGDATVHIVDATGSLRAVNVAGSTLVQGDSIRFIGRTDVREGQPVLSSVTPTVLAQNRTLPPPVPVTTAVANTAGGGMHDATLVRITNATITDAGNAGGVFIVGVNDGSGRLELRIPASIGQAQFVVGNTISATGLLVPTAGGGSWQLRPRSQSDITITP
jgi:hypothetical protein